MLLILRSFVVFNNNRFTRFLILFKQRIDNNVTNKSSIKNRINFHRRKKLEFDDQRVFVKNAFNFEEIYVSII